MCDRKKTNHVGRLIPSHLVQDRPFNINSSDEAAACAPSPSVSVSHSLPVDANVTNSDAATSLIRARSSLTSQVEGDNSNQVAARMSQRYTDQVIGYLNDQYNDSKNPGYTDIDIQSSQSSHARSSADVDRQVLFVPSEAMMFHANCNIYFFSCLDSLQMFD